MRTERLLTAEGLRPKRSLDRSLGLPQSSLDRLLPQPTDHMGTQIVSGVNQGRESSNYIQGRTICASYS